MALTQKDKGYWEGDFYRFEDKGKRGIGLKTNKFAVLQRETSRLSGYVQWLQTWRQYVFAPLPGVYDAVSLSDISLFCEMMTAIQRIGWKKKRSGLKKKAFRKPFARSGKNLKRAGGGLTETVAPVETVVE